MGFRTFTRQSRCRGSHPILPTSDLDRSARNDLLLLLDHQQQLVVAATWQKARTTTMLLTLIAAAALTETLLLSQLATWTVAVLPLSVAFLAARSAYRLQVRMRQLLLRPLVVGHPRSDSH